MKSTILNPDLLSEPEEGRRTIPISNELGQMILNQIPMCSEVEEGD